MKNLIILLQVFFSTYVFALNATYSLVDHRLELDKAKNLDFTKRLPKTSLGYKNSIVWVKLNLEDNKALNLLEVAYPLDRVTFHALDTFGNAVTKTSLEVDKSHSRSHIFELTQIDKKAPVYLEVSSKTTLLIPLKQISFEKYLRATSVSQFTLGSFYGVLLIAILFGLILLITTKEKLYLYITLFLSSYFIFQLSLNKEFAILFGRANDFWLFDSVPLFGGLTFLFSTLFIRELFNYRHAFLKYGLYFCGLICSTSALSWIFIPYQYSVQLCMITIGISSVVLALITIWVLIKEKVSQTALTFSLSWLPFYLLMNTITLKTLGFLPSNLFTNYGMQLASLIGVFAIYYQIYKNFLSSVKTMQDNFVLKQKEKIFSEVRHDIKSPLTSLNYIVNAIQRKVHENERMLLNQSLERLNDIISTLNVNKIGEVSSTVTNEIFYSLIHRIVAEKRNELLDKPKIQLNITNALDFGVFCIINKTEFSRAISNILNNAVEAIDEKKDLHYVEIILSNSDEQIFIDIKDNGLGIAPEQIEHIFEEGYSKNKINGSGLGLSIAKKYLDTINASISAQSSFGKGTTISIVLNRSEAAPWFCKSLIFTHKNVYIVDDDKSMQSTWEQILSKYDIGIICFSSDIELTKWIKLNKKELYNFIFDYDLIGSNKNGLELISEFELTKSSVLVTSHHGDKNIQEFALKLGIKILPKELVSYVPISCEIPKFNIDVDDDQNNSDLKAIKRDVVVIDDDTLVHKVWEMKAKQEKLNIRCFYSIDEFINSSNEINKDSVILLDSNLGNDIKGEVEGKIIFDKGFRNIILQSGHDFQTIPNWVSKATSKYNTEFLTYF